MKTAPYVWNRSGVIVSLVAGGILLFLFPARPPLVHVPESILGNLLDISRGGPGHRLAIDWCIVQRLSRSRLPDGPVHSDEELS